MLTTRIVFLSAPRPPLRTLLHFDIYQRWGTLVQGYWTTTHAFIKSNCWRFKCIFFQSGRGIITSTINPAFRVLNRGIVRRHHVLTRTVYLFIGYRSTHKKWQNLVELHCWHSFVVPKSFQNAEKWRLDRQVRVATTCSSTNCMFFFLIWKIVVWFAWLCLFFSSSVPVSDTYWKSLQAKR
jgi:hypothetical protein